MPQSKENIQQKMSVDKVNILIIALEVIANGNPVSVGLDEITDVAQNALDYFDSDDN